MRHVTGASIALSLLTVFVFSALSACRPAPPSEGVCNDGREWVAPEKVDGHWQEGYCRDIR